MSYSIKVQRSGHGDGDIDVSFTLSDSGVGAARCGVRFNPDENPDVTDIKGLSAALMELMEDRKGRTTNADGKRCFATAQTHLEAAQMFAVKGLFAERNAAEDQDPPDENDGPGHTIPGVGGA